MSSGSELAERSYATYRRELLSASVPWTAGAAAGVTLLFQLAVALTAMPRLRAEWLPNLIQLLVPLLAWLAYRGPLRGVPAAVIQCAELVYTATLIGRLELAATSTSGTALYVAVKMLVTALLVPWGVRVQAVSVGVTMAMLVAAMALWRPDEVLPGAATHVLLGPFIAGVLSVAGAAAADRVRRAVFERERALEISTADLQERAAVDEALARVGRELIALPDTKRILHRLCHLTTEALQCDASHTYLWDAERREYRAAAAYGDTPEQWEALRLMAYPESIVRRFHHRQAPARRARRPRLGRERGGPRLDLPRLAAARGGDRLGAPGGAAAVGVVRWRAALPGGRRRGSGALQETTSGPAGSSPRRSARRWWRRPCAGCRRPPTATGGRS